MVIYNEQTMLMKKLTYLHNYTNDKILSVGVRTL